MEVAGLVVGAAALTSLFSLCVQCFELAQDGRHHSKDYKVLQTKFEAQKARLVLWGEQAGLTDIAQYDERLEHPLVRPIVVNTLCCIRMLFIDGEALKKRYGLQKVKTKALATTSLREDTYARFHAQIDRAQVAASLITTVRWAIDDRTKFTDLLNDLKDLIDDLESITASLSILKRRRTLVAVLGLKLYGDTGYPAPMTTKEPLMLPPSGIQMIESKLPKHTWSLQRLAHRPSSRSPSPGLLHFGD